MFLRRRLGKIALHSREHHSQLESDAIAAFAAYWVARFHLRNTPAADYLRLSWAIYIGATLVLATGECDLERRYAARVNTMPFYYFAVMPQEIYLVANYFHLFNLKSSLFEIQFTRQEAVDARCYARWQPDYITSITIKFYHQMTRWCALMPLLPGLTPLVTNYISIIVMLARL